MAEQLTALDEMSRFVRIISEAEDEYLPSGPPMSPLTGSFFTCWASFDVSLGLAKETLGTTAIAVGAASGVHGDLLRLFRLLQQSRMGIYIHEGTDGDSVVLRELVTDAVCRTIDPSGYRGTRERCGTCARFRSVEFAVEVAGDKYLHHLPLDRQQRMMRQQGLVIDTQTLWDQLFGLYEHLGPSYEALLERILRSAQIGADETWWRLMDRKLSRKWWDWCLATRDAVYHRIHPQRSAEVVEQLLAGYEGVVMSNGFAAYETLTRAGPARYRSAHCWAHVRRKFIELEPLHLEACAEVLDLIGELYGLEKTVPDTAEALELRRRIRDEQSRAVVGRIREWAVRQRSSPQSGLRQAIDYMFKLWPGLTRFLDDPAVGLDNNGTERALRGVVLGRKNHYGSRSERGTRVAALFYSLIETAKLCGIDPKNYLLTAARRAIETPGTVLLPHDLIDIEELPAA